MRIKKSATDNGIINHLEKARQGALNYLVRYAQDALHWSEKEKARRLRKRFTVLFGTYRKKHTFTLDQEMYIDSYVKENFAAY